MARLAQLVLVVVVALASCKSKAAPPSDQRDAATQVAESPAIGDGGSVEDARRRIDPEQARFDEERRPDLIVNALGLKPGDHIADVGAGSGLLTVHLARAVMPGGKVLATDITPVVLTILADRLAAAKLTDVVEARLVEPEVPGLEPATYDAILLAEVDNYLSDPVAWLVAAKPALKPDGAIAITNRVHHRARALAAARSAGLHLVSESTPVPSTFIAVFRVDPPAAPTTPTKPSP